MRKTLQSIVQDCLQQQHQARTILNDHSYSFLLLRCHLFLQQLESFDSLLSAAYTDIGQSIASFTLLYHASAALLNDFELFYHRQALHRTLASFYDILAVSN